MERKGMLRAGVLMALAVTGCDSPPQEAADSSPFIVVSSIFPVGDLIAGLVDDEVRIEVVLPPGASPATFDLTPRQLQTMERASLFVMVGGGLDQWISDLPAVTGGNVPFLRITEGLDLLASEEPEDQEHDHGSGNPHIWLDPVLVRDHVIPALAEALGAVFPQRKGEIQGRGEALADSLTTLDLEIRELLRPHEGKAFIATHSAWSYFAKRYGLEEAGVIHASPGREPSGRALARLTALARERSVTCLFTEPQLGDRAARALANELSLPIRVLDPLGGPNVEGRDGYMALLRYNARELAEGLAGGLP